MVTAVDVPQQATNAAMEQDTTGHGTLSLPVQSDSSSDDDDSVDKTSRGMDDNADKEESTKSRGDMTLDKDAMEEKEATGGPTNTTTRRNTANSRMTSFDIETSPAPPKKRRVYSEGHVWDAFVRRGAKLKGFLEDAMQLAALSDVDTGEKTPSITAVMRQPTAEHNHAADIAREKTAECMILEKVLSCVCD